MLAAPAHAPPPSPSPPALRAGPARLTFTSSPAGWGVRVADGPDTYRQDRPLAVEVVDAQGAAAWMTGGYGDVTSGRGGVTCRGTLRTAGGTQFQFTDTYQTGGASGTFLLTRRVRVASPAPDDRGFSTRFSLSPAAATTLANDQFFVPGVWYKDSAFIPPGGLASDPTDRYFLFREDRLPLPLMTVRDARDGGTLTLAHVGGDPTTFAGEDGLARLTDVRMQFGSLGVQNTDRPSPTFLFPGTEGERTYIYGRSREKRWALRSHPVQTGVPHAYRLLIQIGRTADFPEAVRRSWRSVYARQARPFARADLDAAYRAEVRLLATYIRPYDGVISVPFEVRVPGGEVKDTSSQIGFVGQALKCAALLLRDGLETGRVDEIAHADQVVDFWAAHSMTPSGLPNSWYDIHPGGGVTWRSNPVFLRIVSDGMDGALQAWNLHRRHGQDRPAWLAYCRRYGDWLVKSQAADGSWAREYGLSGRVMDPAKDTTVQPIEFLVDLFKATGDTAYRRAAERAGEYCWGATHEAYVYAGGAADNPNVRDKEAGMCALRSFLALYDLTGDRRWVRAAAQAAGYAETWTYSWRIPVPADDPGTVLPPGRDNVGLSVIAVGHSGADAFMAAAPFLFYRVSLLTGDRHYRDVAEALLHTTKQWMDLDGRLGYAQPAMQTEAMTLAPLRGHGVRAWLPWLTVCQLEPLAQLQDVFGSRDIAQIERLPRRERLRRDAAYGRTRGFTRPAAKE